MRIIIAGSRLFKDYHMLRKVTLDILAKLQYTYVVGRKDIEVLCGMASGADLLGKKFAEEFDLKIIPFPADWNNMTATRVVVKYRDGKPYNAVAGHNRNLEMVKYASQDENQQGVLIAFTMGTDGTKNTIKEAKKYNLHSFIVDGHTGKTVEA